MDLGYGYLEVNRLDDNEMISFFFPSVEATMVVCTRG